METLVGLEWNMMGTVVILVVAVMVVDIETLDVKVELGEIKIAGTTVVDAVVGGNTAINLRTVHCLRLLAN